MKIDIGVRVRTVDGEEIGKVERVIINPDSKEVDALVVHRGLILTRDVVVPLSLIQEAERDEVTLRIGSAQLAALPDFVERHYAATSPGEAAISPYTPGSVLFPLVSPQRVPGVPAPYDAVHQEWQAPTQDVDISEGTEVRSLDGPIGVVGEVRTDPLTDRASAIVVKGGLGLDRELTIPIESVSEVADDHIQLSLTTRQVEALPEPDRDQYITLEGREVGGE